MSETETLKTIFSRHTVRRFLKESVPSDVLETACAVCVQQANVAICHHHETRRFRRAR